MDIFFHHSYNLDLLNLLNIVNGNPHFKNLYSQVYAEFGQPLSTDSKTILQQVSQALDSALISPPIAFGISIIPQFDKEPLLELLLDQERFLAAVEQNEPRLMAQKDQMFTLFQILAPVIQELEALGFREYWLAECLPIIEDRLDKVEAQFLQSPLSAVFHELFTDTDLPEDLDIYFCSFNGGNGVRLAKHTPVVDISFPTEKIFDFALHEFFYHSLMKPEAQRVMKPLESDLFLQLAFEKSQIITGIKTITDYVQENINAAYKSYLLYKGGLLADPIEFLQTYQQGAMILAVILTDHLIWDGLLSNSMLSDLEAWMATQPLGRLMDLYKQALERAGKHLGDL